MPRRLSKAEALEALVASRARHGTDCTGCALLAAARDDDAGAIADNRHACVLLNRFAQRPGHLLVLAHEHVEHAHELSWPVYADMQRLAHQAMRLLQLHYRPARVYTAVLGSPTPLGMSFPHVHVHVVPVVESDERARPARVFSWSEGVFCYDDGEARELSVQLRARWPQES